MYLLFPSLLSWSFFAPTILRIGAAIAFLYFAYRTMRIAKGSSAKRSVLLWYFTGVELLTGLSFFLGFWTQAGAILGIFLSLKLAYLSRRGHVAAPESALTYTLLALISLSLLILGAGAIAFDLPV